MVFSVGFRRSVELGKLRSTHPSIIRNVQKANGINLCVLFTSLIVMTAGPGLCLLYYDNAISDKGMIQGSSNGAILLCPVRTARRTGTAGTVAKN